jgi:hypothetical protein
VAGSCEHGFVCSVSGATELVNEIRIRLQGCANSQQEAVPMFGAMRGRSVTSDRETLPKSPDSAVCCTHSSEP